MSSRYQTAEWIELSGLPGELNKVRSGGWLVFKKIIELDCARHHDPDAVEISLEELGERCGLDWEKSARIITALQKKKYLACFIPDNPDEPGLFQVRVPIRTPRNPEEVAESTSDPHLRDWKSYRYVAKAPEKPEDEKKVQLVIDLYLNTLSQKVNSIIVDQIEILARQFPMDKIERAMKRAARHEIWSIGWVAKDLIRDGTHKKKKRSKR